MRFWALEFRGPGFRGLGVLRVTWGFTVEGVQAFRSFKV